MQELPEGAQQTLDAPCALQVSATPGFTQQSLLFVQPQPEFRQFLHCPDMQARPEQQSDPVEQLWLAPLQSWQVFGPLPERGGRQSRLPQHCELSAHTCPESMHVWHRPLGVHISPLQQSVCPEHSSDGPEGLWHVWQLLSMQVRFPLSQQSDGTLHASSRWLHAAQYPLTQFMPLQHSEVPLHISVLPWQLSQVLVARLQTRPLQQSPLPEHPVLPKPMQHTFPAEQELEQHWSLLEQVERDNRQLSHVPPSMHLRLFAQSLLTVQAPEGPLGLEHALPMHLRLPQQSEETVQFSLRNWQLPPMPPTEQISTRSFCPSSVYFSPLLV